MVQIRERVNKNKNKNLISVARSLSLLLSLSSGHHSLAPLHHSSGQHACSSLTQKNNHASGEEREFRKANGFLVLRGNYTFLFYVLGVFQSFPLCLERSNFLSYVLKMSKLPPTSNFMLTLSTPVANLLNYPLEHIKMSIMCFIMDYQSLSSLLFLCVLFCCFSRINFSFQNFLQNENIRLVGATTKAQDDGISAILKIFLSLQKIFIAAMEVGSVNERERAREGGVVVIG